MNWNFLRKKIETIFREKSNKLGLSPKMDIAFIEDSPIADEFVYGEAFPDKNKIWIEVVAPYASMKEITRIICHELIHLKFPKLNHDSKIFEKMVRDCM